MEQVKQTCSVVVHKIKQEAEGILSFEFTRPDGSELPPFTAGAHVEIQLPGDFIRQYSLCSETQNKNSYRLAVLLDAKSRGGSRAMHQLKEGDVVTISWPRNHFPLAGAEAKRHVLLAGGIGVTPILSMMMDLERAGANYEVHYCARSEETAAFLEQMKPLVASGKVHLHFDGGDPSKGLNIQELLAKYEIGTHLYFCGPPGFMSAIKNSTAHWPQHAVHFEHFAAPLDVDLGPKTPFELRIKGTGETYTVPADQSIVDVLKKNGHDVTTDCLQGYCGACITRYTAGEPEHHDTVLSEKERSKYVLVCCARCKEGSFIEIEL